jgi:hypothetical protein
MIARIITFQSAQAGLLAAQPNWDTQIKIDLELPTTVAKEQITFAESRRNFAQTARYKMTWQSYLNNAADAAELRIFLARIRAEPVLVPLWPDVCELLNACLVGATTLTLFDRPIRSGTYWIIANSDFSTYEILTTSGITGSAGNWSLATSATVNAWPAGTFIYPLIIGRLEERPQPEAITDEALDTSFVVKESSDYPYRLTTTSVTLSTIGANIPQFSSTLKWDVWPNSSRPLDWTEMPDVAYETVGFLRQEQNRDYLHRTARGQELEFYQADRDSASEIELFWRTSLGNTLRFFVPTYRGDLRLLADIPGGATLIRCEKNFYTDPSRETQPGDPFICLIDSSWNVVPYQIASTTDLANESDLNATVNVAALPAATTILSYLMLCRFVDATLEWSYTTPYLATTRIKFVELWQEYSGDYYTGAILTEGGDTLTTEAGDTLVTEPSSTPPAQLPQPAYLFIFTEVGIRTDLFTSYETSITVPSGAFAGTYAPAPFSFDKVKVGLKLDEEKLDIKSFPFTGNPLNKMWPFALDGILQVQIVEVDAVTPSSATAISRFFGDVWSIDSEYKATCIPFGNLFDRQFPRFLLSVSDNYTQFSPPTQIVASSFVYTGTLPTPIDTTSQTLLVTSAAGFAQVDSFFAGGWIETGSGATYEQRSILESTPVGSNLVQLWIDRPLLKASGGASCNFYPGYDGSIDQCDIKFSNRINFGGQPYIPNVNPAVKAITPKQTSGGKKA